jgi:hypothetical protein
LVQVEERTERDTDDLEDRYAQVRAEMEAARRRIDDWPVADLGLETWRAAQGAAPDRSPPDEIEARARPVGMRLFAEKPRRIGARHSRYWSAWSEEQRCHASMDLGQSAA